MEQSNQRSCLIDNGKGVFMILVLLAHTPPFLTINTISLDVKMVIHCVIMPAFFFFSGVLSKNIKKRVYNSDLNLLVPYIIFSLISVTFNGIRYGNLAPASYNIFIPKIGFTWYLIALFIMVMMLSIFAKLKKALGLSISLIISLLICYIFTDETYHFLSIGIAFSIFPVFLLGYYIPINKFNSFCQNKFFIILGIAAIATICILTEMDLIYFRYRPHFFHKSIIAEVVKIACFVCTVLVVLGVNAILPQRKCFLTTIGKNSLMVYLLHEYVYSFCGHLYDFDNDFVDLVIAIALAISLSYMLSRPLIATSYHSIVSKLMTAVHRSHTGYME